MEWNEMEWNDMEWNDMEWYGMKWNEMRMLPQACSIRRGITELVASVLFQFYF